MDLSLSSPPNNIVTRSYLEKDLLLLILKFLRGTPLSDTAEVLADEMEEKMGNQFLRHDYTGNVWRKPIEKCLQENSHLSFDSLLDLCKKTVQDQPQSTSIAPIPSLLNSILPDGNYPGLNYIPSARKRKPSRVQCLQLFDRQRTGKPCKIIPNPTNSYQELKFCTKITGHLSPIYCMCLDKTETVLFTGADDNVIKAWELKTRRLLYTFRGHKAEICELDVNQDNKILASAATDKDIRIWNLGTCANLHVLHAHGSDITGLQFCPFIHDRESYLISCGREGAICFWIFNIDTLVFRPKPIKIIERSRHVCQILSLSLSPGGAFVATGASDCCIRVYGLFPENSYSPVKLCELEGHMDVVDSISFASHTNRFVSGSCDGFLRVFSYSHQQWSHTVVDAGKNMDGSSSCIKVCTVLWSPDDRRLVASVSDNSIKVFNALDSEVRLTRVLRGHKEEVFCLRFAPHNTELLASCGHDGKVLIWNVATGRNLFHFENDLTSDNIRPPLLDMVFAANGRQLISVDSYGALVFFRISGCPEDPNEDEDPIALNAPTAQFFHTDFRGLLWDQNGFVQDESLQRPCHLMPPPWLITAEGVPLPGRAQRRVPGRAQCRGAHAQPVSTIDGEGDYIISDFSMATDDSNETLPAPVWQTRLLVPKLCSPDELEQIRSERIQCFNQETNWFAEQNVVRALKPRHLTMEDQEDMTRLDLKDLRAEFSRKEEVKIAANKKCLPCRKQAAVRASEPVLATVIRQLPAFDRLHSKALYDSMSQSDSETVPAELENLPGPSSSVFRPMVISTATRSVASPVASRSTASSQLPSTSSGRATRNSQQAAAAQYETENATTRVKRSTATGRTPRYCDAIDSSSEDLPNDDDDASDSGGADDAAGSSDADSEYSDWGGAMTSDVAPELQPPSRASASERRTRQRRYEQRRRNAEALASRTEAVATSSAASTSDRRYAALQHRLGRAATATSQTSRQLTLDTLPEEYHVPSWMLATRPSTAPLFPQLGDEVVYSARGHRFYVDFVKKNKLYEMKERDERMLPWNTNPSLKQEEFCLVTGLKIEIRPPRLICLQLEICSSRGARTTGNTIEVKYHDVPGVIDFIILRQMYDLSIGISWRVGDRFKSFIDDTYFHGRITGLNPACHSNNGLFLYYECEWQESGETDRVSPWDMIPESGPASLASHTGAFHYVPKSQEWPPFGDRDVQKQRILHCLDQVMALSVAEPFLAPVDYETYPHYLLVVEYPICLTIIRERIENDFYRRLVAISYDVRFIEKNAVKFNQSASDIVKQAKIVSKLLLAVMTNSEITCIKSTYQAIVGERAPHMVTRGGEANPRSGADLTSRLLREVDDNDDSASEEEDDSEPTSPPPRGSTTRSSGVAARRGRATDVDRSNATSTSVFRRILTRLTRHPDSGPFLDHVDPAEYPDYTSIVRHPMNLARMREKLTTGGYTTIEAFVCDLALIFKNSRLYNFNRQTAIYRMTSNLWRFSETLIRELLPAYTHLLDIGDSDRRPSRSGQQYGRYETRNSSASTPNDDEHHNHLDSSLSSSIRRRRGVPQRSMQSRRADAAASRQQIARTRGVILSEEDDEEMDDSPVRISRSSSAVVAGPSTSTSSHAMPSRRRVASRSPECPIRPQRTCVTRRRRFDDSSEEDDDHHDDEDDDSNHRAPRFTSSGRQVRRPIL